MMNGIAAKLFTSSDSLQTAEGSDAQLPCEKTICCPGALEQFGGDMFLNYPWHLHSKGLTPHSFGYIDTEGRFFRARSPKCTGQALAGGLPCDECSQVVSSQRFREIMQRATLNSAALSRNLNFQYQSYSQLSDTVHNKNTQLHALKLQVWFNLRCLNAHIIY